MKEQTKKNLKTAATVTGLVLGATYLVMRHIAKKQYPDSVCANQPEEQNPVQGRKVVFIENANDPVNADGKQGHLEAVANITHIPTFYEKYIKRGFDVILSFGGLVVLAPVYAVTALAIKADDPGPVFFKQKRVGTDKSYFELLKFRSMSVNTPKDVPTHMLQNGGITKVGGFIRKTSIDELPQLWNIFRGNMSIIGPRPALWNQDYLTAERDKYGANDIKPGLTGLAQISGRDELEIPDKAKLDGVYARELSKSSLSGFIMDMKMFFGSVFSVLKSEGVVEGGTGALAKEFAKTVQLDISDADMAEEHDEKAEYMTGIMNDLCDTVRNEEYKVSIIMPAYNAEKYISEAIESILAQTYNNWELIVVDDNSTDGTVQIIKKICDYDSRIKLIQHNNNQGVSKARNTALDAATGDFIAFLDADDKWVNNKLEQQLDFMIKNNYVLTYTDYQKFDSNTGFKSKIISCPPKMTANDIYKNTAIACLTVMINRKRVGAFHMPNLSHTEDQITWQEILKRGYIAYGLNKCLSMYRVGNQSLTSNQTSSAKKQWRTYRNYYGFSIPRSAYYFSFYAFNAIKKHFL